MTYGDKIIPSGHHCRRLTGDAQARREKLTWTPVAVSDAAPKKWYSQDEIFRTEEKEDGSAYPFGLNVKVLGGNYCGIGPFHSLAAAEEAAERIWGGLKQGKIHYSQIRASGFVAVASRALLPSL